MISNLAHSRCNYGSRNDSYLSWYCFYHQLSTELHCNCYYHFYSLLGIIITVEYGSAYTVVRAANFACRVMHIWGYQIPQTPQPIIIKFGFFVTQNFARVWRLNHRNDFTQVVSYDVSSVLMHS